MYWQNRYLDELQTFKSLAGLEIIDLPNKGLLSGIEIRVWGVNAVDTGAPDCWLHDRIKKFEVMVNGSQVVKSLDGRQLISDMLYKRTPIFSHDTKNMSGGSCEEYFYINFGRYYHDLDYMLDLSQVNDPELRMETDFALTSHNGFTNGVAMTVKPQYNIILHLLREPEIVPKGYVKTSELYRFLLNTALQQQNMTVPRGPTYSNLYVQDFASSHGISNDLKYLELNINSDDIIPFRKGPQDLCAELARRYGLMDVIQQMWVTGAQLYPHPIEQGRVDGLCGGGDVGEFCRLDLWGNVVPLALRNTTTGAVYAGPSPVTAHYYGVLPFGVAALPCLDPIDERFWIDTSKLGDIWVRFEATAGAKDSVVKLLGDEVVTRYVTPSWP